MFWNRKKNLVLSCVNEESNYEQWISGKPNFDLCLICSENEEKYKKHCKIVETIRKNRWPAIYEFVSKHDDFIRKYDFIWIPFYGIETSTETINELFARAKASNVNLGHPALTSDSDCHWKILLKDENYDYREVNLIDTMCPIFSYKALLYLKDTFAITRSGHGLEIVWPYLLYNQKTTIFDCITVKNEKQYPECEYEYYFDKNFDVRYDTAVLFRKYKVKTKHSLVLSGRKEITEADWRVPLNVLPPENRHLYLSRPMRRENNCSRAGIYASYRFLNFKRVVY